MSFIKLSKNSQVIVMVCVGILALHFFNLTILRPIHKEKKEIKSDRSQLREELSAVETVQMDQANLEKTYQERYNEYKKLDEETEEMESTLPSKSDMSRLLGDLTAAFEGLNITFESIEPTINVPQEGQLFESIDVLVTFHGGYPDIIAYLKKVEKTGTLLGVKNLDVELNDEVSPKPLVKILFSSYLSNRPKIVIKEKKDEIPAPKSEAFNLSSKPYDNKLTGSHKLSMVIWTGKTPIALIDGKVMKVGAVLENKKLTKIEPKGVWFSDEGVEYFLGLETKK